MREKFLNPSCWLFLGLSTKVEFFQHFTVILLQVPFGMVINISALIDAYTQGFFLMADDNGELGWYSSNQRALIPLDNRFHCPKSLRPVLNQNIFSVAIDRDFRAVCEGCADRKTTWISDQLKEVYWELHIAGRAHSFETWLGDELAGGILGIVIQGAFIGESMFYRIPNGSKVAMVKLVEHLRSRKFVLFDAQLQNPHLARFGAYEVSSTEYNALFSKAIAQSCRFD